MNTIRLYGTATVVLMALAATSWGQSADQAVQAALRSVGDGNPQAAWNGLPASYQQDIASLAHSTAAKIDPAVWDRSFVLGKKLADILKAKKQMVLASPQVAAIEYAPDKVEAAYDTAVQMFSLLVTSELTTSAKATKLDVGRFTGSTGKALLTKGLALREQLGLGPAKLAKLKDATVTLVGEDQSFDQLNTILKIEVPGEAARTVPFIQVESKWVPQRLDADWAAHMAEANAHVAKFPGPGSDERKQQLLAVLDAIDTQLNLLAKAENADQFNVWFGATQLSIFAYFVQLGLGPEQLDANEVLSAI